MVWAGISMESRTELYLIPRGAINAERYINEILADYVVPYAQLVGNGFLLMQDNARPHTTRIVRDYLNNANIPQMDWPPHSPDLNPIEHVWDMLGRRIRNLIPAPRTLDELRRALSEQWAVIPQEDISRLVQSMPRRIDTVIQARGGNTRY